MKSRVVITGMGVVAPNGVGLDAFSAALKTGSSGIEFYAHLKELGFSCCIGGIPKISEEKKREYFTELQLRNFNSASILYGCIAGVDAWRDAGLEITDQPDFDSGTVFGAGTSGVERFREAIYGVDNHKVRRLGSTVVAQTMASGVSAYLSGMLGLGNQVTTNSSACTTGTESLLMGYDRIQLGKAKRMLVGSSSEDGPYVWGGFDAMRVLTRRHNESPEAGSRPMSATASGFVPGSGAGALVLESLESAQARNARIYAEIIGGSVNAGGQRNGGTMTAPNSKAVQRCIREAIADANIRPADIDTINAHLTATIKDPTEIQNWATALNLSGADFPYINALKSTTGHCLSASGSIESVASVLQIKNDFIFPSINCEDLHPEIEALIGREKIPTKVIHQDVNIVAKASFGFGDVNGCIILKKF